jgi:hypothetical protein
MELGRGGKFQFRSLLHEVVRRNRFHAGEMVWRRGAPGWYKPPILTQPLRLTMSAPFTRPAPVAWLACALAAIATARAADMEEGFDGPTPSWAVAEGMAGTQCLAHERSPTGRRGGCERLELTARAGAAVRLHLPLGPLAVIDELRASLWVRSSRPDVRLALRVVLPDSKSRKTGQPVETLVFGAASRHIERWEMLEVADVPQALHRQLPALRMEHGSVESTAAAVVTHVVLDAISGPGHMTIAIDDLVVQGGVARAAVEALGGAATLAPPVVRDPAVRPASGIAPPADPPAGLARGVLEVDGLPFFPRSLQHAGEPFPVIAALGFNCVQLPLPATAEQLADARRAGLWVICPPPPIPDVDVRDPDALPTLRNWDRVLLWDLGSGLGGADVAHLAERTRRVRTCDPRAGRPLIAGGDSDLRGLSRHVDLLVARRTVLGTTLELTDYVQWLRERPLLARPGTPLLATLATEVDTRAARQAAAIAGVGGRGLAIDPESLALAASAAVAAGAHGILCTSSTRLDADHPEARKRAAAVREMNLRLKVLEPWAAMGRFTAQATTSDPDVQAYVMEAARARVVMAWRSVPGAQIVARRYGGADVPQEDAPLTLLVPGVPEAHQAWEIAPGGLRPLKQRRVTGGVSVTFDSFLSYALVLFSGDPVITGHMQERLREVGAIELAAARSSAAVALADAADLLGRLPPQAFTGPPPVAAAAMLSVANTLASEGESLAAVDPGEALVRLRRAAAIAGQFERRIWENGVRADGSMVASPLLASDATIAEHWRFVEARASVTPGAELLPGGGMERIDELAASGWRHFAQPHAEIRTGVEIMKADSAAGSGHLRLVAAARDPATAPVVVETPPLWITTPPLVAPAGKLLEITALVRVPSPITGSVDGLFVFDSLGGPALAERVRPTNGWKRLVLYRIVPADAVGEPLVVTFALTGFGAAEIDEVSVKTLERGAAGLAAAPSGPAAGGFLGPADLLAPPSALPPPQAAPPAAASSQWPGMTMEWPKLLPFGQSSAPPPGVGGGTIDPFKRARAATAGP